MGLRREQVEGLDALLQLLESLEQQGSSIYVLFSGGSDPQTGQSWCPDCTKADPVIEGVLAGLGDQFNGVLVHCSVGDRDTWKDPHNSFRTHPTLKLTGVPTLLKWKTPKRLGPEECSKEPMVKLIFEDED